MAAGGAAEGESVRGITGRFVLLLLLGLVPVVLRPSTDTVWLWLLLVLLNTAVGLIGFALFGSPRLDRRRQARQDQAKARIRERTVLRLEPLPTTQCPA